MRDLERWSVLRNRVASGRFALPLLVAVAVAAGAAVGQPPQHPADCVVETENLSNAIVVWEHAERWLEEAEQGFAEDFTHAAEQQLFMAAEAFVSCER